jgi:hypothetical protein
MTTKEKPASNFELNVIKLGIHTFQLVKGDRFETNGGYFHYVPSTAENKGKGSRSRYSGRSNNISAKKYEKDVLRADNIELIEDRLIGFQTEEEAAKEEEARKAEGWKAGRMKIYEVKYAYKQELPKNENLVLMSIELGGRYGLESKQQWTFKSEELEVKRVTAENYFLVKSCPIGHHSQIPKKDLNNVRVDYGTTYYVLCLMDEYNDAELALFKFAEKAIKNKIQTGHDIVQRETNNLNKFLLLKSKQGY